MEDLRAILKAVYRKPANGDGELDGLLSSYLIEADAKEAAVDIRGFLEWVWDSKLS